jgi:hypothetical protein
MKKSIVLCMLAAGIVACLVAQDTTGTIEGSVLDASGGGVPNAKVTITNADRNQVVRTSTTDSSGNYSAPLIPVGTYAIKVEAAAARRCASCRSHAQLRATGCPDAGRGLGPTDELYIGNSAPSGTAATLPYSVNGNRNSANNWTVDGADNVDRGSNLTLMTFPSVDAIAEFKVERSLYTADTGRAGGAQISVVTKSGTSQFHGGLYEFFRNDALAPTTSNNANKVNVSIAPTR